MPAPPPFASERALIGVVHLPALRDRERIARAVERAREDARALAGAGFDGVLVENYGDAPFRKDDARPHTVASLALAAAAAVDAAGGIPVGVNVLRNDALAAIGIAVAAGASFVRANVLSGVMFTDQGVIEGRAADVADYRALLKARVSVHADVLVKHATAPPGATLEGIARDTFERAGADALIVTGTRTGEAPREDDLARVRRAVPKAPLLLGSGLTPDNAQALLRFADGAIVGTAVKHGARAGNAVDRERARRFARALRKR